MRKLLLILALALLLAACGVGSEDAAQDFGISDQTAYPLVGLERTAILDGSIRGGGFIFFYISGKFDTEQGVLFSIDLGTRVVVLEFPFSVMEFVLDGTNPPAAQFTWANGRTMWSPIQDGVTDDDIERIPLPEVFKQLTGVVTIHISSEVFNDQVQPIISGSR